MIKKIKVLISGSEGRMGKVLQKLISETEDIEVTYGIDIKLKNLQDLSDLTKLEKNPLREIINIYLDFTNPKSIVENVRQVSEAGIDSIIGTTGWYDKLDEVKELALNFKRRILYTSNFSPGVNILFYTTRKLAKLLGNYGYDVAVREMHHTGKIDAPSGTAITLGNTLLEEIKHKNKLVYERRDKKLYSEIDVIGNRVGKVAGHHEVWFTPEESYSERLILQHDVFTPEVFGIGAIMGIRWMIQAQKKGKPPGLYTFYKDVLGLTESMT